jgi:hypothetical protein
MKFEENYKYFNLELFVKLLKSSVRRIFAIFAILCLALISIHNFFNQYTATTLLVADSDLIDWERLAPIAIYSYNPEECPALTLAQLTFYPKNPMIVSIKVIDESRALAKRCTEDASNFIIKMTNELIKSKIISIEKNITARKTDLKNLKNENSSSILRLINRNEINNFIILDEYLNKVNTSNISINFSPIKVEKFNLININLERILSLCLMISVIIGVWLTYRALNLRLNDFILSK